MIRRNPSLGKRLAQWVAAPLRAAANAISPSYDAVGSRRRIRDWNPGNESINALLQGAGEELRAKSRDVARRNEWAAGAIEAVVSNVIGSGIVPQSQHSDPKIRERLHEAWREWTDEADASGCTDFYGLQALACREVVEGGEVFGRLRHRRASDGLTVPLQIQLLESEHVPFWKTEDGANSYIRGGVEFNLIGKRTAYWMYPEHPSDFNQRVNNEPRRVPAEEVLHMFRTIRAGQHRGEPWLSRVLTHLHDLEKYDSAELIRKQLAAMFAGFVEDLDSANPLFKGDSQDEDGIPMQGLEPGSIYTLPSGKKITFSEPGDVGGMYSEYMRMQLHKIASGFLFCTYEQLTGDLTRVNYSSIRAGLLEFRRRCEMLQYQMVVFQFCRPVWRAWVQAAILSGVINALDFERRPEEYLRVEWRPQAWPWVDPLKDLEAEILAIDNLLKSRSAAIKERGYDPEQVDREIADDQAREAAEGLQRRETSRAAQEPEEKEPAKKKKPNAA